MKYKLRDYLLIELNTLVSFVILESFKDLGHSNHLNFFAFLIMYDLLPFMI